MILEKSSSPFLNPLKKQKSYSTLVTVSKICPEDGDFPCIILKMGNNYTFHFPPKKAEEEKTNF